MLWRRFNIVLQLSYLPPLPRPLLHCRPPSWRINKNYCIYLLFCMSFWHSFSSLHFHSSCLLQRVPLSFIIVLSQHPRLSPISYTLLIPQTCIVLHKPRHILTFGTFDYARQKTKRRDATRRALKHLSRVGGSSSRLSHSV